jgi:cell wall-associated NlpC family hydrolase
MNSRRLTLPLLVSLAVPLASLPGLVHADDPAPANVSTDTNGPAAAAPTDAAPPDASALAAQPVVRKSTHHASSSYTVTKGDTLSYVAHKFHTTITELKKLNHLTSTKLRTGEKLKVPRKVTATADDATPSDSDDTPIALHARRAQPVQDFDVSTSTFASCPVPVPSDEIDAPAPAPAVDTAEVTSESEAPRATPVPVAATAPVVPATDFDSTPHVGPSIYRGFANKSAPPVAWSDTAEAAPSAKPARRGFLDLFSPTPAPVDWGARFTQAARELGDRGLSYDDDWCPPGESHSWSMDCSNTTRYLYRETAGIELPRTASDQYYYLHLQNKAWDVPQTASGFADCNYLRANLKPGDLLFWENTYRPERQPPITHVMVFLGTNARGEWIMAGSQSSRGGEHNRPHGGPDIYVFDPTRPCGGYSTWMGLVHHQGRFCAFGRPLEADKAKLAVAAND